MARSTSQFAYLDTGSEPKLEMIRTQVKIINDKFDPKTLDGYCVGIPGAGLQTPRHRDEYCNYGIPEERQVMVDYDYNVHMTQVAHMSKLNYKGKIICGELGQVVNALWKNDKKVDVIDYDDVSFLLPRHERLIRQAAEKDVKVIILVVTNRCNKLTAYHEHWKTILNLHKRYVSPSKGYREPIKDIQEGAIKTIGQDCGYDVICKPYAGRDKGPPMMSCVLLKRI